MHDIPCPCCGFLTLEGEYGSYAICPVCDWEDDPVQLANPASAGGANSRSLAEAQSAAMARYPASVEVAGGYGRSSGWRPLSSAELEAANARRAVKHWYATAIVLEPEAYWRVNENGASSEPAA
ncbi:CPCC family cysteine-rich protein [Piscinibacter terrae]|uniref:Cysteine-rich CPCC domain-containing protein n=1 Tax=Piscinibacter terrae TaxID=2496871 RepID=A0A3N7JJA5_9BURK|nr:CPCC family cysteine-rich protein [Albitalea terrae]RQP21439.1 hypothetical protein DZC73_28610 [Albitalea terrae]